MFDLKSSIKVYYWSGAEGEIDASYEEILIPYPGIIQIDFSDIGENDVLQELIIEHTGITSLDLAPLRKCRSLRRLSISNNKELVELDLSSLSDSSCIKSLSISKNKRLDELILPNASTLRVISLTENENLRMLDLTHLKGLFSLKKLTINGSNISRLDLSPLSNCTSLQQLVISKIENLQELILPKLTSLQELVIERTGITSLDLSPLSNCKNLYRLVISEFESLQELILPKLFLIELDIGRTKLMRSDLRGLYKNSVSSTLTKDDLMELLEKRKKEKQITHDFERLIENWVDDEIIKEGDVIEYTLAELQNLLDASPDIILRKVLKHTYEFFNSEFVGEDQMDISFIIEMKFKLMTSVREDSRNKIEFRFVQLPKPRRW